MTARNAQDQTNAHMPPGLGGLHVLPRTGCWVEIIIVARYHY